MKIAIAAAVLGITALSASSPHAQQPAASGQVAEAEKQLASGDIAGAISSLQRIVGATPKSFDARLALGRALDLDGRHADARRHLEEAIKLASDSERTTALTTLGVSYAFESKAEEAARYYQRAFDADIQAERSCGGGGPRECAGADLSRVRQLAESRAVVHHRLRDVAQDSRAPRRPGGPLGDAPAQRARQDRSAARQSRVRGQPCGGGQGAARHAGHGESARLLSISGRLHRLLRQAVSAGDRRAAARDQSDPFAAAPTTTKSTASRGRKAGPVAAAGSRWLLAP